MRIKFIQSLRRPAGGLVANLGVLMALLVLGPAAALPPQAPVTGLQVNFVRDGRIGDQRIAILVRDWPYCYPPTGELILVPRGYVTDFASIPFPANHLIDRYGDDIEPAVVHDWLYAVGGPEGRAKADEILRYALMEQKVGLVTRNVVYDAVRVFGSGYGAPKEWQDRWGDPNSGHVLLPPTVAKPRTAVVGRIDGDCRTMEQGPVLQRILAKYGSDKWPKP